MPVEKHSVAGFGTFTASQFAIIARAMDEYEAALKNQTLLEKRGRGQKITNLKTLASAYRDAFKMGTKMSIDGYTSLESYIGKTPAKYTRKAGAAILDGVGVVASKTGEFLSQAAGIADLPYLIGNYPIFGSDEEGNN
ncbi:MAG: hypothetical protein JKX85_15675 [Phycisphaeraceae bacterium]|nr:hypothetical protein [Phycisphaeraceae bacterium]